jgi:hypothetical protein
MKYLKRFDEGFLDFFKGKKKEEVKQVPQHLPSDPLFNFTEEQKLDIDDIFIESKDFGFNIEIIPHEIASDENTKGSDRRRSAGLTAYYADDSIPEGSDLVIISGKNQTFKITRILADDIDHLQEYLLPNIIKIHAKGWKSPEDLNEMVGTECSGITIKVVKTKKQNKL